ncbi:O-acyltransferase (WSD1-like) family protein [Forsythia ovata]|uniref:O-acyltransferase (WSD1-like) family protein n=1 Tax=Forsythia ovata TaxID=205694 RepID=A0ABD1S8Y7_9LAMI
MEEFNFINQKEEEEPVSPTGQYFTSSVISVSVIGVLELQVPIDDSQTETLIKHVFLPINPRFSSIMVKDKKGVKHWKKVEVKIKDHTYKPIFPEGKSVEFYDDCFTKYLSKLAMDQLPQSRPLWEIHVIKYPSKNAAGNVVFKLHHALGDGFSLMGALLSCLQRADNPKLPLTFPALMNQNMNTDDDHKGIFKNVTGIFNTVSDFGWSLLKSSVIEDDKSPIRSGEDGVEFRPITITTMTFSLDQIKKIKANLQMTINGVICGVIFLGTRLYMQEVNNDEKNANSTTALVLLNTRNIGGYKSVQEMVKTDAESQWGNQFAFIHVSLPHLTGKDSSNPLNFAHKAQEIIKRKKNSSAVILTGKLLDAVRRYRGPEATAKCIHSTLKNTSMTVSNVIGPVERVALANQPIKGMYFMVVGVPQNLTITMVSYMGQLRVAVGTENGLIDSHKYKSCVENAFDLMFKAATSASPAATPPPENI